ncbi:hypothetical protein QOT17_022446 [Balamuthia mandrillaris]
MPTTMKVPAKRKKKAPQSPSPHKKTKKPEPEPKENSKEKQDEQSEEENEEEQRKLVEEYLFTLLSDCNDQRQIRKIKKEVAAFPPLVLKPLCDDFLAKDDPPPSPILKCLHCRRTSITTSKTLFSDEAAGSDDSRFLAPATPTKSSTAEEEATPSGSVETEENESEEEEPEQNEIEEEDQPEQESSQFKTSQQFDAEPETPGPSPVNDKGKEKEPADDDIDSDEEIADSTAKNVTFDPLAKARAMLDEWENQKMFCFDLVEGADIELVGTGNLDKYSKEQVKRCLRQKGKKWNKVQSCQIRLGFALGKELERAFHIVQKNKNTKWEDWIKENSPVSESYTCCKLRQLF